MDQHACIADNDGAGDVGRIIGCEKRCQICNLHRLSHETQRIHLFDQFGKLLHQFGGDRDAKRAGYVGFYSAGTTVNKEFDWITKSQVTLSLT